MEIAFYTLLFSIPFIVIVVFLNQKHYLKIKAEENKKEKIEKEKNDQEIEIKLKKVDRIQEQLSEIQLIKIIEISEYKKIIVKNEKLIIEKGGDNQLQLFMKLDSFLRDFRERIVNDQAGLKDVLDLNWLKSRIIEESKRDGLDKLNENFTDIVAKLEGKKQTGFDSNVDKLLSLGDVMKPVLENQIKTMEYYHNISVAMIVFYLNDKKIRYFEIHEAFEKLGVFDSTWQKNVLKKLDSIEVRLAQISNQLTDLNRNFVSLIEASENVVAELKEINSGIMTSNLLQAITAYQTWRINKNTKSLKE